MGRLQDIRVIDEMLTGVVQGYTNPQTVYSKIFPVRGATKEDVKIPKFGKESFKLYNARRAPRAEYARIDWAAGYIQAVLHEYGLEIAIDQRELAEAPNGDLLRMSRVKLVKDAIDLLVEKETANQLREQTKYPPSNVKVLSGTSQWSDYDNSNPIDDIAEGIATIMDLIGLKPNKMLLPTPVWNKLKRHPKILAELSTGRAAPRSIARVEEVAEIFELKEVIIAEAVYMDGNATYPVWGKDVIIGFVAPEDTQDLMIPAIGYTVRKKGYPVDKKYFEAQTNSEIHQVSDIISSFFTGPDAGYLIKNAVE